MARKYLVFDNDVAPERDGVYQREFYLGRKDVWQWSRFSEGHWYCAYKDYYMAESSDLSSAYQKGMVSGISTLRWRGLAQESK